MTAATQDVTATKKLGTEATPPPALLALPVEANVLVYGGTLGAADAAGNAVPAKTSAAVSLWGRTERQINNLNTNTPFGAAGAQQVTIRPGPYYFFQDGSITAGMVGQPCFALDDQTVTSNPTPAGAGYWLPYAGMIMPPAVGEAGIQLPSNNMVAVWVGYPSPYMMVFHAALAISLAQIVALGAATTGTINLGPVTPPNFRLIDADVQVLTPISGGAIATATLSLFGGADANTSIFGATNVFTGAPSVGAATGTNPYPTRPNQQLKAQLTTTVGNLNAATAGSLLVDVFYTLVQ